MRLHLKWKENESGNKTKCGATSSPPVPASSPPPGPAGEAKLGGDAVLQRQCQPSLPPHEPRGQHLPPSLLVLFCFLKDTKESQRRPAEIQRKPPAAAELRAALLMGEKKQVKLTSRT